MKFTQITLLLAIGLGTVSLAGAADAGCVKGAIIGGLAGHLVGHGAIGAAAGCAYGVHEDHKTRREQSEEGRSSSDQGGGRY